MPGRNLTDNELNKLTLAELQDLIDSDVGTTADRSRYIDRWLDLRYSTQAVDGRLQDAKPALINSILEKGIDNNPVLQYVDKFFVSNSYPLDNDYVQLARQLIDNGDLNVNDSRLYADSLYNESVKNNLYKMKAFAFVSDPANVRKWGLYKNGNPDDGPLTVDDISGKSAAEVKSIVDSSQTAGGEENTFQEVAYDQGYNQRNSLSYFRSVIDKSDKTDEEKSQYKQVLDVIAKDSSAWSRFNNSDASLSTIQNDLFKYLDNYRNGNIRTLNNRHTTRTTSSAEEGLTIKDYLAENNLQVVDLYAKFGRRLAEKFPRGTVSKRRALFAEVLNSTKRLKQLLNYPVDATTDDSALESIYRFLTSLNKEVIRLNRTKKAEADLKNKEETRTLLNDVVDAMVDNFNFSKPEVESYFKQVYRPGMSDEEAIRAILNLHNEQR